MRPLSIALILVAGCAAAPVAPRHVAYRTSPETVWSVVVEELTRSFPALRHEDALARRATTCWVVVDKNVGSLEDMATPGWKLYRIEAALSPEPPWRVELVGVAADYTPGLRFVSPVAAGSVGEPYWVGPRTDRVYERIFRRLERAASPGIAPELPPPAAPAPPPETVESTCIALAH